MEDNIIYFDKDTPKIEQANKVKSLLAVNGDDDTIGSVEFDLLVLEAGKNVGDAVKIDGLVLPTLGAVNKKTTVRGGATGKTFTYTDPETSQVTTIEVGVNMVADLFWDGELKTWSKYSEELLPYSLPLGNVEIGNVEAISGDKVKKALVSQYLNTIFTNLLTGTSYLTWTRAQKGIDTNDAIVSIDTDGLRQITVIANGNSQGINMGLSNYYVVPANTPTRIEALFKMTGLQPSDVIKYFINHRGGVRYVEFAEFTVLSDGFIKIYKDVNFPVECRVELLGLQKASSAVFTSSISMTLNQVSIENILAPTEIPSLLNDNTRRIVRYVSESIVPVGEVSSVETKSVSGKVVKAAIDQAVDTVKMSEPIFSESQYTTFTRYDKGVPTNDSILSINSKGKAQIMVPVNGNASGINGGLGKNYIVPANTPMLLEVLIYLGNLPISAVQKFFINHRNGVRYVNTASVQDMGSGYYRFYANVNYAYECRVELLGFQYSGASTFNQELIITVEEIRSSLIEESTNIPSLVSEQTQKITSFVMSQIPQTETKLTEIVVSADENHPTATFKGKNAVQLAINSINDASDKNRYRIKVLPGLYKITNSSEFIGNIGYPAMIVMKDYVDVEGVDKENTIFWAELPENDADIDTSVQRILHQTLWHWAKSSLKNVTLVAKNLRYTIHQDSPNTAGKHRGYDNVDVIFLGNKGYLRPWGLGTWSGESNEVVGGKTVSSNSSCWSCHNNSKFSYPSSWSFKNHKFVTPLHKTVLYPENDGSLLKDKLELIGCSFDGGYIIDYRDSWLRGGQGYDSFDHAEWRIYGHSNSPFLFQNSINKGFSLRVKSLSTGLNSKVRFDTNASAYTALIKNPRESGVNLLFPEIQYIDGYLIKDGSVGLSGWANGCVDLYEGVYTYDSGVNYTSMGKRLGDCSVQNKSLTLYIDGVERTITFNTDYTDISNATILAKINGVISTIAVAELYTYGKEYYPEITDVMEVVYNASSVTPILKGTVLTKEAGKVRPAQNGDVISGVALDDIPVFSNAGSLGMIKGSGRMLKRGYISTDPAQAFFIRSNKQAILGDKFLINNGVLESSAVGDIKTIDSGIISINCN